MAPERGWPETDLLRRYQLRNSCGAMGASSDDPPAPIKRESLPIATPRRRPSLRSMESDTRADLSRMKGLLSLATTGSTALLLEGGEY